MTTYMSRAIDNTSCSDTSMKIHYSIKEMFWANARKSALCVSMRCFVDGLKCFFFDDSKLICRIKILQNGVLACGIGELKDGVFTRTCSVPRNTMFAFPSGAVYFVNIQTGHMNTIQWGGMHPCSRPGVECVRGLKDISILHEAWEDTLDSNVHVWYVGLDYKTPLPMNEINDARDETILSLNKEQTHFAFKD